MSRIAVFAHLARYNAWANDRLFSACAGLSDASRRRDLGIFFRSIHGTLNHVLLADRLWLGRLAAAPRISVAGLDQELYADFDELRRQRRITDTALCDYVAASAPAQLDRVLRYRSLESGSARSFPIAAVLTHLFNHQTHHRGQVTAAISQLGGDYGVLDLIGMPLAGSV